MSSQIATLLGVRYTALRHRLGEGALRLSAGVLTGALAIILCGHFAAPGMLIPPMEIATPTGTEPRSALIAGASALETAFWLTALISSVTSFRIMELLFRRDDIRIISALPLNMKTLFIDRVLAGLLEVACASLACALFFIPLLWHDAPWAALVSCLLPFIGLTASLFMGLGIQLYFGEIAFGAPPEQKKSTRGKDVYGGAGQAFLYAPGAALALSAGVALLSKLALGEVLRLERCSKPAQIGLILVGILTTLGLLVAYSRFKRAYIRMLAGFREVDFIGFNVEILYQTSNWNTPTRIEAFAPNLGAILRRNTLQYARRYTLTRYLYVLIWTLMGLAMWQLSVEAFPSWAIVCSALITHVLFAKPWTKLTRQGFATSASMALPLHPKHEDRAMAWFATFETLRFATPLALLTLTLRTYSGGAIHAVIFEACTPFFALISLNLIVPWMQRRSSSQSKAIIVYTTTILAALVYTGLVYIQPILAFATSITLATAHIIALKRTLPPLPSTQSE